MGFRITPGELHATKEKILKINARAVKRGFTGRLDIEATRVEVKATNDLGFETTEIMYDVEVIGNAPSYAGWTFLAKLDWDREAGLIVHTAPGVGQVDRTGLREGYCDHCKTDRYRKATYLVGNDRGETAQVGSTCLKDFLGWPGQVVFLSAEGAAGEIEGYLGGGGYAESRWPVETVLAAAWAAIQVDGYKPASSYDGSTKGTVLLILDPRSKWDRKRVEEYRPYIANAYAQAKVIHDWLLSDGFTGDNEFVTNLRAIAAAETCSPRNVGYLASAPQVWAKAQERDLIRRQQDADVVSEYVGAKGDKIEREVRIKSLRAIDGDYGTTMLYVLEDVERHNIYKWFSSNWALGDTADDKVYKLRGTVKDHQEFNGLKSTVLTRCKVLDK